MDSSVLLHDPDAPFFFFLLLDSYSTISPFILFSPLIPTRLALLDSATALKGYTFESLPNNIRFCTILFFFSLSFSNWFSGMLCAMWMKNEYLILSLTNEKRKGQKKRKKVKAKMSLPFVSLQINSYNKRAWFERKTIVLRS